MQAAAVMAVGRGVMSAVGMVECMTAAAGMSVLTIVLVLIIH